ncbi:hypothetical protein [Marinobacter metalliresistant]|uniref:Cysteinyl-tRNA synthetase n=1 Tax=Marinobacter metalliresistant TaxID=2961995 RepID=A0ABZ2VXX8_9GAMM
MSVLMEGRLTFTFQPSAEASQYDDWAFYRNQFNSAFGSTKAVDFICVDNDRTWLIEVKDYRANRRTKTIDLGEELAFKVRDTLAGLAAAKVNANDQSERSFARKALKRNRLSIVLHLEQPDKPSKLFPQAVDKSKLLMKLKQTLKAVDPHPRIVDQNSLRPEMQWQVTG